MGCRDADGIYQIYGTLSNLLLLNEALKGLQEFFPEANATLPSDQAKQCFYVIGQVTV